MQIPFNSDLSFSQYTFGRNHYQPPPLKADMQMESLAPHLQQMGEGNEVSPKECALPDDFDHMVRAIGEW